MKLHSQRGMSIWMLFLFVLIILLLIFGIDLGYIFYSEECMDKNLQECAQSIFNDDEEVVPAGAVIAVGAVSGKYGDDERSVTFTLNIPLEGGPVTGSFEGDCEGTIKGTFAGGNGGAISGKGSGKCLWVMPASGEFSGTVNESAKTVIISGKGRAAGFSGEGTLTLSFK